MKKNLLIALGLFTATILLASGPYEKAMAENIPAMFRAKTAEELQAVINKLDRVGAAEGDKWEPYYYSAYGYIRMSGFVESGEEKDQYLDLALEALKKGEAIKPNDSELESIRGYVHMIRITVDPANRGMMYSGMAFTSFQKAVQLNPNNPRAHYLLGQMQYGTAQFMGNGDGGACKSFFQAMLLFEKEESAEESFAPSWGKEANKEAMAQMCEGGE